MPKTLRFRQFLVISNFCCCFGVPILLYFIVNFFCDKVGLRIKLCFVLMPSHENSHETGVTFPWLGKIS